MMNLLVAGLNYWAAVEMNRQNATLWCHISLACCALNLCVVLGLHEL